MKKFVSFLLLALGVCLFLFNLNTQETQALSVKFKTFEFVTKDYNPKQVHIKYEKMNNEEKAHVIDNDTGSVLETMTLMDSDNRVANISPYTFKRSVSYGGTRVEFSMNVELYNQGSFREIHSYQDGFAEVFSDVKKMRLEGFNHNVWSPNGFPTTELYYAFNGTLLAELDKIENAWLEEQLQSAGFSKSKMISGKVDYRKNFNSNGIVKLYSEIKE